MVEDSTTSFEKTHKHFVYHKPLAIGLNLKRASLTEIGDNSKIAVYDLPNASQKTVFSGIGIQNKARGTTSTGNVDYDTIFTKSNVSKSYKKNNDSTYQTKLLKR